ncbi:type II toxin-antitoxin system HicB family antitoxin [Prosthecomicrobium pneumaticum]|uniref:Putative RNase H-like HicB family nuclease n=1 Tax=Prosthecomicrobium pneumaticum TaxID=81895 RepID=A0A7W9CUW2_9HYPH|nr:type II toxin-antitoxin system HicB family antitoxin [Prosthecomicrobium pneumaticum]MBB5751787.1 putative RNase H-like HicB family nuclease [Prosthecomicrobium pneumaticum]
MTRQYLAIIDKDPESAFGVRFPDVEGCFSAGDTLEEATHNAVLALRQHIETLESLGWEVPLPRPYESVVRTEEVREALAEGSFLISVPLLSDEGRTVRINVSLDRGLLTQIDDAAAARGLTRSAFLAQAAREKIAGGPV